MRRRALRAARTVARGAPSSAIHSSASVAADVVTTPSPPGPMAGRTLPLNILSAAAEGVGAFHAAQTAALKTCPTGFAAYLAVYLEQAPCTDAITSKELLLMPRPFNAPTGRVPCSSRRRARWAATRAAMTMANQAAAAVSWLACGSPSGAQARASASRLRALRLSGAQREAAAGFLARARSFARRGLSTLRGGRATVASLLPILSSDAYDFRERVTGTSPMTSSASFVVASRVSLPTAGAVVPVSRWLSPEWTDRLSRPDGLLRPDCREAFGFAVRPSDPPQLDRASVGRLIPKPAFLIRRSEYRPLLQLLRARGLVVFRDPRLFQSTPSPDGCLSRGY